MDNVDAREGVWDFAGPNTNVWPTGFNQVNDGRSRLSFVTDGEFVFLVFRDGFNHLNFVEVKKTKVNGRVAYTPGIWKDFRDQSSDPISIDILGNATYNRGFFYIIYTIVDDAHIFFAKISIRDLPSTSQPFILTCVKRDKQIDSTTVDAPTIAYWQGKLCYCYGFDSDSRIGSGAVDLDLNNKEERSADNNRAKGGMTLCATPDKLYLTYLDNQGGDRRGVWRTERINIGDTGDWHNPTHMDSKCGGGTSSSSPPVMVNYRFGQLLLWKGDNDAIEISASL